MSESSLNRLMNIMVERLQKKILRKLLWITSALRTASILKNSVRGYLTPLFTVAMLVLTIPASISRLVVAQMINTSTWKNFCIGDLFNISSSKDDIQPKNIIDGDIPLISSGKTNNGTVAYIQNDDATLQKANTITVDMFGKAFYQKDKYFAVSHGRVNILTPKYNMTEYQGLFLASVIERVSSNKYEFNEMCTGTKLTKDIIGLPTTSDGQPDWAYMESYMKQIMKESEKTLENLKKANSAKHSIDVSEWGEFRVGDLFNVHPTKAYKEMTNAKLLDNGDTPVIVNSAYNNGIGGTSTQRPTENGNMITFSDTVDANTIFYQPDAFIGYPHVQGLYPIKYKDKWTELTYQFFVSVFRGTALSKGFNYGNKFRRDIATELIVRLPISSAGEPDWQYMNDYMRKQFQKSELAITTIQSRINV